MGNARTPSTTPTQNGESVSWSTNQPMAICWTWFPALMKALPTQRYRKSLF
jgi:hypothetical protein